MWNTRKIDSEEENFNFSEHKANKVFHEYEINVLNWLHQSPDINLIHIYYIRIPGQTVAASKWSDKKQKNKKNG